MDNIEERAREWCNSIINRLDTSDLYRGYVQGAVEERAEFKEYLEKKMVELSSRRAEVGVVSVTCQRFIMEIIKELFGEE